MIALHDHVFSHYIIYGLKLVEPPPQLDVSHVNRVSLSVFLSFQEVFTEMEEKYGEVEEMNVCDNLGDHLVGNVYVKVR